MKVHDFDESLAASHKSSDLSIWKETYLQVFPTMIEMIDHRDDGWHQRAGIDRSIVLSTSKQVLVDEKVRAKDYGDILLEYESNTRTGSPGWAIKPLMADYIAYLIAPAGKCYFLPVPQMQAALQRNKEKWWKEGKARRVARNKGYNTLSIAVETRDLLNAISDVFISKFSAFQIGDGNA